MHFYHGTSSDFSKYDYAHVGKGNDAFGSGFYFTSNPEVANMYATSKDGHPNVHRVFLKVENPIYANENDETPLKREHIKKIITSAPDHKESLMNFGDVDYEGYNKVLNRTVDQYADSPKLHAMYALNNDFYQDHTPHFLENMKSITGHDAVIFKDQNHTVVNVFHPTQIKSAIGNVGKYDTTKHNITESKLT